ncbi:hypothetical protein TBLA_0I02890 [Henningerozyma blattae CBS 6284]|uniref:Rad50/SbcC-type AAA domain-containing protein n=1 Tax=Henningerozyma blattae (strain ATCC 34711 / CBS 6284 / DSM 70876 / NBRC 10599 / NRRL Y-10934 / UCD 77-7) TaxID=1071380 RepID=I2H993_HENB6|nr:hypothetical protein TBLA_0I02890 [Tetrapisispora blattae CBS 6284]CCH62945.1 hypothetical protein TBLA_0I02890 [Tetrapisispora blattae CBS 6284]
MMTSTEVAGSKRPLEENVDNNLLELAAEYQGIEDLHKNKKRRHNFVVMSQHPDLRESQVLSNKETLLPGYIKKIKLVNFMCHEHFELTLGPRLNFIVGNNGSGKSAILTAITIGLGAKANSTNRGNSLKDLIKNGCNQSKITIILENNLENGYSPDIYGPEIIIERTLKREGSSSFVVKSASGVKISDKKKDLQQIVDYFSVPVGNPMCFLSQDAARSFLTASTPEDKYFQFMKGTFLLEISKHLTNATAIYGAARENMIKHKINLNRLKTSYNDATTLLKNYESTSNLNDRKLKLQGKSLWIDIKHNQLECKKLEKSVNNSKEEIATIDAKIKSKDHKIQRYLTDEQAIKDDLESKYKDVQEKKEVYDSAIAEVNKVRDNYNKELQNEEDINKNIEKSHVKLKNLSKNIENLENKLKEELGTDKDLLKQELSKCEELDNELNDAFNAQSVKLQDLQQKESQLIHRRNREVHSSQESLGNLADELRRIKQGHNDFLNGFDRNMKQFLSALKQHEHEFTSPPIGPLGQFVTITENYKQWTRCVQRAIGRSLSSFIVTNQKDSRLFQKIMKSERVSNITCFVHRFEDFDFSRGKAQCQYPTILDILEFSDLHVRNIFIDYNKIEKIILIDNMTEARNFLRTNPKNVSMALSLRDERTGFFLSGGSKIDTVYYANKLLMKMSDSTTYLNERIQEEQKTLNKLKREYDEQINELKQNIRTLDNEKKIIQNKLNNNTKQITELKKDLNKVVDTGVLDSAKDEYQRIQNAIVSYETALEGLKENMNTLLEKARPLNDIRDTAQKTYRNIKKEFEALKQELEDRDIRIRRYKDDITIQNDEKARIQEKIDRVQSNINDLMSGIETQIENASEFCSEEESTSENLPDNQDDIRKELEDISRKIKRNESDIGVSYEKALELYEQTMSKFLSAKEKYIEMDNALSILNHSIKSRTVNFGYQKTSTFADADFDFRNSLRIRKFKGKLDFGKTKETLNVYTGPQTDKEPRNVDTLSGGEKSFSQIALLLATWKPMRSRIIALDEYDVFMDQVNRKTSTQLIVQKLKDDSRTQTIIITPQDIGKITDIDSDGVNIHRLRDPERLNNSTFHG